VSVSGAPAKRKGGSEVGVVAWPPSCDVWSRRGRTDCKRPIPSPPIPFSPHTPSTTSSHLKSDTDGLWTSTHSFPPSDPEDGGQTDSEGELLEEVSDSNDSDADADRANRGASSSSTTPNSLPSVHPPRIPVAQQGLPGTWHDKKLFISPSYRSLG